MKLPNPDTLVVGGRKSRIICSTRRIVTARARRGSSPGLVSASRNGHGWRKRCASTVERMTWRGHTRQASARVTQWKES